jgi:hypothetical protein
MRTKLSLESRPGENQASRGTPDDITFQRATDLRRMQVYLMAREKRVSPRPGCYKLVDIP